VKNGITYAVQKMRITAESRNIDQDRCEAIGGIIQ
jgi:hypothetical protein